jgi:hypothetical protein
LAGWAESEEVAGFFAAMVKTDYAQKPQFVKNFFDDWRTQFMSKEEKALITDFKKWYAMGANTGRLGLLARHVD